MCPGSVRAYRFTRRMGERRRMNRQRPNGRGRANDDDDERSGRSGGLGATTNEQPTAVPADSCLGRLLSRPSRPTVVPADSCPGRSAGSPTLVPADSCPAYSCTGRQTAVPADSQAGQPTDSCPGRQLDRPSPMCRLEVTSLHVQSGRSASPGASRLVSMFGQDATLPSAIADSVPCSVGTQRFTLRLQIRFHVRSGRKVSPGEGKPRSETADSCPGRPGGRPTAVPADICPSG